MASIKKLGTAVVLAGVMSVGLGSTTAAAKGKTGGSGQAATCSYLYSIITYPYTSPSILVSALSLYNYYGCNTATQ